MWKNSAYYISVVLLLANFLHDVDSRSYGSRLHNSRASYSSYTHNKPSHASYSKPSGSSGYSNTVFNRLSYPKSNGLSGNGGQNSGSSYPTSNGLSGSGSQNTGASYPTSNGLSGNGGRFWTEPSYPSSTGLSGSGNHNTVFNRLSYTKSNGLSGNGGQNSGSSYPTSSGLSGSGSRNTGASYPTSNGLSENGGRIWTEPSHPSSTGLSGSGNHNTVFNRLSYTKSNGLSGNGGQNSGSSYPTSSGLSGSGSRNTGASYPTSNGLSENGGRIWTEPSHPSSTGLSGSGNHNTGFHGLSYPTSNGLSGNGGQNSGSLYPTSNGLSGSRHRIPKPVSYPVSNGGLSGSGVIQPILSHPITPKPISYPISNGGLSGNKPSVIHHPVTRPPHHTYPTSHNNYWEVKHEPQKIHHHHHYYYHYSPPRMIHYIPSHGSAITYPVYSGQYIPPYVYEYRSSESKYRQLLSGLALYNLGMISSSPSKHQYHDRYVPRPDEICIFGVRYKDNYDEMGIDCRVISNFVYEEESAAVANTLRAGQDMPQQQVFLPNETLVDHVNDSKFNGNPITLKSKMDCYVIRTTRISEMKKSVPCDLLQMYSVQSLRKNSAVVSKSSLALVLIAVSFVLMFTTT